MSLPASAQTPPAEFLTDEQRWLAILSRTPNANGKFIYAVRTTGVFCRPNCASKRPLRHNVRFFESSGGALRAGFRACRRCRPTAEGAPNHQSALIRQACRLIETEIPHGNLQQLARRLDISPYYFHRCFKAAMGLTPKRYAITRWKQQAIRLPQNCDATSNGSAMNKQPDLRTAPLRKEPQQADGSSLRYAVGECWLGNLLVATTERGICAISLGNSPTQLLRELRQLFPDRELVGADSQVEESIATIVGFLTEPGDGLHLPLDWRGTPFQQRVWNALRTIPFGSTMTYTELANRIGAPAAVRAVASACAANQIAIAIPCHRVIRSDGSLSGFRWGVERKARLLKWESMAVASRSNHAQSQNS